MGLTKRSFQMRTRPADHKALELIGTGKKICEVGVEAGTHALDMYRLLQPTMMYMVDFYQKYEVLNGPRYKAVNTSNKKWEVESRFKGIGNAKLIINESTKTAKEFKNKLDYVYIDASHNYEDVLKDLDAWYPTVKKGGLLAGHDWDAEIFGVRRAVEEWAKKNDMKLENGGCDWWVQK
jgi:hypothetical protein